MRTIEINVCKFEELSKEAKENALNSKRFSLVDFHGWWDDTYEDFKEKANKYFDIKEMYFSGFHSQGDGAMFTYSYVQPKLLHEAIDSLPIRESFKKVLKDNIDLYGDGKHPGRYYHERSICHYLQVEFSGDRLDYSNINELVDKYAFDIIEHIEEKYRLLARELYSRLEQEYELLISDEYLKDFIEANEYEFYEDGTPC